MSQLKVDPDVAFSTSRSVINEAVELHEQLAELERDWDNLSRSWSGAASAAYTPLWEEWLGGANSLVGTLEDLSSKVAAAAAEYVDRDGGVAESIDSAAVNLEL